MEKDEPIGFITDSFEIFLQMACSDKDLIFLLAESRRLDDQKTVNLILKELGKRDKQHISERKDTHPDGNGV
jgi:hypothetical protein